MTRSGSERGRYSRNKGVEGERQVAKWLRSNGFPGAVRAVRTATKVSKDPGDITGTPGIVWQLKVVAERELWRVPNWVRDTEDQRQHMKADLGILVVKRNGCTDPGNWWAFVPAWALTFLATDDSSAAALFQVRCTLQDITDLLIKRGYGLVSVADPIGDRGSVK